MRHSLHQRRAVLLWPAVSAFAGRGGWAGLVGLGPAPARALAAGDPLPDIDLPGSPLARRLSDLKGQVVYVDFWASWCGPCRQSFPWMNEMQRKYADRGLQIVAINVDARRSDADAFLARNPAGFALAFDNKGEAARRLEIKAMPTSLLVGADGRLLLVHTGFRSEDRADLEARLVSALGAKPTR